MVGPIRNRRTNFHSIADLARSDSSPYSRVPELHSSAEVNVTSLILPSITSLKVKMHPSPVQSVTSFSTPIRAVGGIPLSCDAPPSPFSPTISDDSGYGQSFSTHNEDSKLATSADTNAEKLRKYRKQRTVFESAQLRTLEETFAINAYPSSEEYESLSNGISIDEARLRIWFQNRRARYRRSAKHTSTPTQSAARSMLPFHLSGMSTPPSVPRLVTSNSVASHLLMYGTHPFLFGGY